MRRSFPFRTLTSVSLAGFLAAAALSAQEPSALGRWKTVDDRTNQVRSIVHIEETNGELRGKVERIFAPPAKESNPLCEKCPGDFRNKPVVGMQIIWGLKLNGNEYTGGRVMDPEDGKTYKCKLRGYVGFSLIGRTQTWVRE